MVYFIPFILCVFGHLKFDREYGHKGTWFLWVIIYLYLVLLIGLRYKVGGDTYNYMEYFNWCPELDLWEPFDISLFEPGFTLFSSAIKTIWNDIYFYQTVIAAIMVFLLMSFIKQNTRYIYIGMLLVYVSMFLYFSTEIIRESIAVCICLLSYKLLENKKYLLYYAIALLSLTIHSSASFMLILPFFLRIRLNGRFLLVLLSFMFICLLLSPLIEYLSNYYIFEKLLRYNHMGNVGYAWKGFRTIYFSVIPFVIMYLCKFKYKIVPKFESIVCVQILMGIGIWFYSVIFQRLINYTCIFVFVSIAEMLGTILCSKEYRLKYSNRIINIRRKTARILLVLLIAFHSSFYIHLSFYERYYPYHSVFDPVDEPLREKYVAGQD